MGIDETILYKNECFVDASWYRGFLFANSYKKIVGIPNLRTSTDYPYKFGDYKQKQFKEVYNSRFDH